MTEKSLVLIKPDAVERNLIGKILAIYEENDLKIVNMKLILANKEIAEEHYSEHKGQPYFEKLIKCVTCSPLIALILEGDNAILRVRDLNKNVIRPKYAIDGTLNSVHASDSEYNAEREINIWFKN